MRHAASSRFGFGWLRRVGRVLAVVAQLVVLLAPVGEMREERSLAPHVEVPGSSQHTGHNPERCPACILLGIHSQAAERSPAPGIERAERLTVPASAQYAVHCADVPSNSCRAPPSIV